MLLLPSLPVYLSPSSTCGVLLEAGKEWRTSWVVTSSWVFTSSWVATEFIFFYQYIDKKISRIVHGGFWDTTTKPLFSGYGYWSPKENICVRILQRLHTLKLLHILYMTNFCSHNSSYSVMEPLSWFNGRHKIACYYSWITICRICL